MLEAPSDLPNDVAALRAFIALQDQKLMIFEAEIKERDYRIEKLRHELAGLRRHRFGSRSEAIDQLERDRPVKSLWRTGWPASYAGDAA